LSVLENRISGRKTNKVGKYTAPQILVWTMFGQLLVEHLTLANQ
jgi:hypothetical protein